MRAARTLEEVLRSGPNPLRGEQPVKPAEQPLRILFLVSAHNSLSQRAEVALTELGHDVSVAVVDSGAEMETAVAQVDPELIVCPILKKIIPASIFSRHRCLIVHPGPRGDKGPSSLDWAIELGADRWGVTVLEATADVDGGAVWATRDFEVRDTGKSSLYRHEVRRGAIEGLLEALGKLELGIRPEPLDAADPRVIGRERPLIRQPERAIDWTADPAERSPAASAPPRATPACSTRSGPPSSISSAPTARASSPAGPARSSPRATARSAARRSTGRCGSRTSSAPTASSCPPRARSSSPASRSTSPRSPHRATGETYRELRYEEHAGVGYLHFDFYNGAMSVEQCERLRLAYLDAIARRETKVSC